MSKDIYVFIEQRDNKLEKVGIELGINISHTSFYTSLSNCNLCFLTASIHYLIAITLSTFLPTRVPFSRSSLMF